MAKKTDTWMPLYIGDYLRDTTRLTTEQHGAYLLLLMDYWCKGAPPDDDSVLAAIAKLPPARWRAARIALAPFFKVEGGLWVQKRVEAEKADADEIQSKRSAAGRAGVEANKPKRAEKTTTGRTSKSSSKTEANGSANGKQTVQQTTIQRSTPSPSPSPSPVGLRNPTGAAAPELTLEAQVYALGKAVLGNGAGGQITKLRRLDRMTDARALELLNQAKDKENPGEWIAAVIRNGDREGEFELRQESYYRGVEI